MGARVPNRARGIAVSEPVGPLVLQFLDWVSARPRTYAEAMDAWRSTCPRFTVWEDALLDGLVRVEPGGPGQRLAVMLTPRGRAILNRNQAQGPAPRSPAAATRTEAESHGR